MGMSKDFLPDWAKEIEKNIPQFYDSFNWGYPKAASLRIEEVLHSFIYPDMIKLLDALNDEIKERQDAEDRYEE